MTKEWSNHPKYTNQQLDILYHELVSFSKSEEHHSNYLILAKLLLQRGISSVKDAIIFNNLEFKNLHDPFLMKGMELAVERIFKAIDSNQKIMVYGDYDVDGTTSVALMMSYLKSLTSNLIYYIPDRYTEGYGISKTGIDFAKNENAALIIALDCGIKAVEKIEYANNLGVDFIICDHHTPGDTIPDAIAILDPKQNDCSYPYKELSGCGIGFKLCQALEDRSKTPSFNLSSLLDFVAISTACDIVPITRENRVLASLGLKKINETPRPSITALLGNTEVANPSNISDLVFKVGPKINAAGRISSGKTSVDLLLATNKNEIDSITQQIIEFNDQRKEEDKRITEEALEIIKTQKQGQSKNSTVLYQEDWHKGVIGIVASRVIEKHYRPTIILTKSRDGIIGGSVRSVKGFDVYQALESCANEMIQFGGHKYAAGLTLEETNLTNFKQRFEEVVTQQMEGTQFTPEIKYDAEIEISSITKQLKAFIDKLEPFGPQNMTPTFVSRNLVTTGNSRLVGNDKLHLKLELTDQDSGVVIPGIAFNLGHLSDDIISGEAIDIAYTIDVNHWKGKETLQLMVKDIKFTNKK